MYSRREEIAEEGGGDREASEKDSEKRGIWDVKLKSSEAENSRSKFAGSRTVDCLAGAPSQPASEPVSQSVSQSVLFVTSVEDTKSMDHIWPSPYKILEIVAN